MNVKLVLAVVLVCGLASLTGCSSMSKKGDSSALTSGLTDDVDLSYIQLVNAQANERGYVVLWVNPPQKPRNTTQHD